MSFFASLVDKKCTQSQFFTSEMGLQFMSIQYNSYIQNVYFAAGMIPSRHII